MDGKLTIFKRFLGIDRKKKILMFIFVLPIVIFISLLVLERCFKLLKWFVFGLNDMLHYVTDKENRGVYIFSMMVVFVSTLIFEYNFRITDKFVGVWNDVISNIEYVINYIIN